MPHRLDYYRLQLAAAMDGDHVALEIAMGAAALAVARNQHASPLARVLGAVAGGVLDASHAETLIASDPQLQEGVRDLVAIGTGAQVGDLSVGVAAGRDIITVNVYVGEH